MASSEASAAPRHLSRDTRHATLDPRPRPSPASATASPMRVCICVFMCLSPVFEEVFSVQYSVFRFQIQISIQIRNEEFLGRTV
jgi:hypothetical protein